jgi:hypothetical protein
MADSVATGGELSLERPSQAPSSVNLDPAPARVLHSNVAYAVLQQVRS